MTRRVVTLPAGLATGAAKTFARRAKQAGAHLLEVRTDLHPSTLDPRPLARELGLLVAERAGVTAPAAWLSAAAEFDAPVGSSAALAATLVSHHAEHPLRPDEAARLWSSVAVPQRAGIKHVEPLGEVTDGSRLLETHRGLVARFGSERVTVLATGACALPLRATLRTANALDYVALDAGTASAPGQRLLADAVRADDASARLRLGIIGSGIAHSRSPRIHEQPFDRVDVPPDAPIESLVDSLLPHYRGLAITSPFKRAVARHLHAQEAATNTLVRDESRWRTANTDIDGAGAVLDMLGSRAVTVLGSGGAAVALRAAAERRMQTCDVVRRSEVGSSKRTGLYVWTWPSTLPTPAGLQFADADVAVVAYGPSAHRIARQIVECGGRPVRMGPRWFIAQARRQRELWSEAR